MINLFLSVIYNLINLLTEINWSDSSAGSKYIFEVVNKENLSFLPHYPVELSLLHLVRQRSWIEHSPSKRTVEGSNPPRIMVPNLAPPSQWGIFVALFMICAKFVPNHLLFISLKIFLMFSLSFSSSSFRIWEYTDIVTFKLL